MIFSLLVLVAILTVSIPLMIIIVKTVWQRKLPRNYYTPFDYLAAQTEEEFHEEQNERELEEKEGDAKRRKS
ncbi:MULTISPECIES: DUF3951 domain-containing protein [Priestia]|jgi:hypothetical protein|uniref:DUF3951 domain-containing protein n=1 Tax=Priestia megaterium (strain DSM 319 / IMG 1521) TaxID=592022 RepID=D5DHM5_PRIM3|nr:MULTISPECIES: DUF3951 domain-containing protein [Priestia]ADF39585.1 hypothetical protein BMD_2744 [Priestia megaterium DSM 319]MBY0094791.1 DUF3951 domain-containing protein [Priestia aryabhattai]MBY0105539.1 DUF3951 domain-containing protein [Priestia aryabhattai]MCM3096810.1 DUF3951 domain-containing protein [Priestia megaterium]MCM3306388.1 DUF3951 domain-containing protein [Priestia megaterium]